MINQVVLTATASVRNVYTKYFINDDRRADMGGCCFSMELQFLPRRLALDIVLRISDETRRVARSEKSPFFPLLMFYSCLFFVTAKQFEFSKAALTSKLGLGRRMQQRVQQRLRRYNKLAMNFYQH